MRFNCSLAHGEGSETTDHQDSPTVKSAELFTAVETSSKIRSLKCPCCNRKFAAPLDVMRHLDSDRCASGVTSSQIYNLSAHLTHQFNNYYCCPNDACARKISKFSSFVQHTARNKNCMVTVDDQFVSKMIGAAMDALQGIVGPRAKKSSLEEKDLVAMLPVWYNQSRSNIALYGDVSLNSRVASLQSQSRVV